uniref:Ribosomal protein S4 n=1 Tax=Clerodendrum yunnanense TaxID=201513 RepID=A0A6M8E0N9_9LAMI|nr:ribosomal protein S4 [Clerodendrum yunnanense]
MPAFRFKSCRLLGGNVWNRELTIIQRRILKRLRSQKRSMKMIQNQNSYMKLQTTRKLSLFYGYFSITEMDRRGSYIPFLLNLERRLDVLLVRLRFCQTLPQARQPISHRKVCVNHRVVNRIHWKVSHGDLISFQENDARTREKIRRFFYIQILIEEIIGKWVDRPVRMWRRTKTKWFQNLKTKNQWRRLLKSKLLKELRSSMHMQEEERIKFGF